jgi:putative ABC transport system ATP-binding protein
VTRSSHSARPAVAVEAVTKVYGAGPTAVRALDEVSVRFLAREFTAIMGPSGSGKSTLMHCSAGLDTVSAGRIRLYAADGSATDLTALQDAELTRLRRTRIGFVFQGFNLLPALTARQNMLLPLELAGQRVDVDWMAAIVGVLGLGDRLEHRPAELSGGQQQRVACARALLPRPDVIFADEPTGNLDSRSGREVLAFLRRSVDEFGQTVVMVTHDAQAAAHADRAVMLTDGRVAGDIAAPTTAIIAEALARADA